MGLMIAVPAGAQTLSLRDGAAAGMTPTTENDSFAFQAEGVENTGAPISSGRAVLYSLLLPGLGDYKLGNNGRATAFFVAEGAIWISYATFQVQGGQREDEYESLAVQFAGVSSTGHSDEFYAILRDYDNSDQYAADVKTDGRFELAGNGNTLENINADALDAYFLENRVEDYEPWRWSSLDRRLQYSEVRSSSKTSYRRADYMIAAAAANRVISAVFAYAGARSASKAYQQQTGYDLRLRPSPAGGMDVTLSLARSF